jgi:general secretion pathway protein N
MKRPILIATLAVLAFAIILLVRLPAAWVKGFLPDGVACVRISGTAWNGNCAGLLYKGAIVGNLNWELHPLALFRGKVSAFVSLTRGEDFVRGEIEAGSGGNLVARQLQAQMPLNPPLVPELSSGYAGNVSVNLAYLRVEKNVVAAIEGQLESSGLTELRTRTVLGSYSLVFPKAAGDGEPVGQLTSLDGPVDFEGTLRLTRQPGWAINGKVRLKPDTPPRLAQQLAYLGTPDPDGTRPLALEGTY